MHISRTQAEMDAHLSALNGSVGFVPTMGALHEGHLSLIDIAKEKSDIVVVSIFVNPTQFAPHEDFDAYPREEEKDLEKLKTRGVDIVFIPSQNVLYQNGMESDVKAGSEKDGLETDFRPHFFDGVVNVVYRLFQAVKPDLAVFGEKDFQQLQVIREMVKDQNLSIEIMGGPIARDEFGLALSSRNAYLSSEELKIARLLNVILKEAAQNGDLKAAKEKLLSIGFDKVDYVEKRWNRVLGAGWVGKTRLIDNIAIS
ncbi:MAG: pantoate--beta-alanine ligase [Alphaproteobacteria bacterium]|nr:pantoate--beta-alanine ligase [Alphaproteobacteria bacterium]